MNNESIKEQLAKIQEELTMNYIHTLKVIDPVLTRSRHWWGDGISRELRNAWFDYADAARRLDRVISGILYYMILQEGEDDDA